MSFEEKKTMSEDQQKEPKQQSAYEPSLGVMTKSARSRFLRWCGLSTAMAKKMGNAEEDDGILSLRASLDRDEPLYFWQIFSLTGRRPIVRILTNFYNRVFDDHEAEWFRSVFEELTSKDYHIQAQSYMWLDCFGAGRMYGGGDFRIDFHHRQMEAMEIMTEKGAERWVYHMKAALDDEEKACLNAIDPRLRVAINTFLQFFLEYYGSNFRFPVTNKKLFGEICHLHAQETAA